MKFKKVLLAIFAVVLCLPAVLLAGCGQKPINIETYFEKEVNYSITGRGSGKGKLADYTSKEAGLTDQFTRTRFTGKSSWLYKMKLEYIEFDIYSNQDVEDFEIFISITNMVNGDETLTTGSRTHVTDAISLNLKANEYHHVRVAINDTFADDATVTSMEFYNDTSCFRVNNQDTGFKYSICRLKIYAKH